MLGLYFFLPGINTNTDNVTYSQFLTDVRASTVKSVDFGSTTNGSNTTVTGMLTNGKNFTTVGPPDTSSVQALLKKQGIGYSYSQASTGLGTELLYWLILLAPLIFIFWLFRRMSQGRGRSLAGRAGRRAVPGQGVRR